MVLGITVTSHALPVFEYELWMQAETSFDVGQFEIAGKIVNTGTVALNLTPQWGALSGAPGSNTFTTCDLDCVSNQLSGSILEPGQSFNFIWMAGDIQDVTGPGSCTADISGLACASVGLIPLGSDWHWGSGGFIPELLVSSVWVNGPANTALPFNKTIINLGLAGQYITGTPLAAVPEPSTLFLLGSGLVGLGFVRRRFKR